MTQSGHCRVRLSGQSLCPPGFVDLLGSASVPSTSGQLGDKLTLRTAKQAARRPTLAHSKTHEARKAVSEIHITKDGPYLVSGNLPLAEVTIGTNAAGEFGALGVGSQCQQALLRWDTREDWIRRQRDGEPQDAP
jgi:hypothetical protein